MRAALLLLLLATASACQALVGESPHTPVRLLNRTDRPLVAIAFSRDDLPLLNPRPVLYAEEFERQKVAVGQQVALEQISGYELGDDLILLLYARPDELPSHVAEQYGPGAAPLLSMRTVTAGELRERAYLVVVRDLRP